MSLIDGFGRRIDYLRVSVTDRCDLRCSYCMPQDFKDYETPAHWLSLAETARIVGVFAGLGVSRVRLTGGEPLLRAGLAKLVANLAALPQIEDIALSTNGTQLQRQARALKEAGVSRLNVSLDTLDRQRFASIARRDVLADVIAGLDAAAAAGFRATKINMVWLPETPLDEVVAMIAFCRQRGFVLRLIETMPVGDAARQVGTASLQQLIGELRQRFGLIDGVVPGGGPARYLVSADGDFSLGFITPLSQHFCATCNRVRLTVDGQLYLCLGHENQVDLRTPLRAGADDQELAAIVTQAMAARPERHEFVARPRQLQRTMSRSGG